MEQSFDHWLNTETNLSSKTKINYSYAINAISNDMMKIGILKKTLDQSSYKDFLEAYLNIINNTEFRKKTTKTRKCTHVL